MRHRRGIDFTAGNDNGDNTLDPATLSGVDCYVYSRQHSVAWQDIPEWYEVGARCFKCKRAGLLDRYALARKYGRTRMIITLERFLRCTRCGNKKANDFVLAKVHRNW